MPPPCVAPATALRGDQRVGMNGGHGRLVGRLENLGHSVRPRPYPERRTTPKRMRRRRVTLNSKEMRGEGSRGAGNGYGFCSKVCRATPLNNRGMLPCATLRFGEISGRH